ARETVDRVVRRCDDPGVRTGSAYERGHVDTHSSWRELRRPGNGGPERWRVRPRDGALAPRGVLRLVQPRAAVRRHGVEHKLCVDHRLADPRDREPEIRALKGIQAGE